LVTFKTSAAQTGKDNTIFELLAPRGMATPLHRHAQDDESFYLLEGEVTFYLPDSAPFRATTGTFVHIPGGTVHAFQINSTTARFLTHTTAQHERFLRAAGEPAHTHTLPPPSPPAMEKVLAAADQFGVEILGPPPATTH
jgi:quercetin dioxygenase-like cupin family protein